MTLRNRDLWVCQNYQPSKGRQNLTADNIFNFCFQLCKAKYIRLIISSESSDNQEISASIYAST